MSKYILILYVFLSICVRAQEINIIPQPSLVIKKDGVFKLTKNTPLIVKNQKDIASADYFNQYLKSYFGFELSIKRNGLKGIVINTVNKNDKDGYIFNSDKYRIIINGNTTAGTFYGIQTLIQLLPTEKCSRLSIPAVSIEDEPAYQYRGMLLDVCRHFFSIDYVKKYIDYLAFHKMNYFHWHLTDDQGWRIEIKKYPNLSLAGAWRNGTMTGVLPNGTGNDCKKYGGYYTQKELREVVDYAAKRHITIIPEIEMPGHASAAIAAYPYLSCFINDSTKLPGWCKTKDIWCGSFNGKQVQQVWGVHEDVFCAGKESTYQFIEDVLDEVLDIFPSKYIHIGGDECPKENWKRCLSCNEMKDALGLENEHELQSYFVQRIEKYLNKKGRILIGWEEILEGGLAPNAIIMSWRNEKGGILAAEQDHQAIMAPSGYVYLNTQQTANEDSISIDHNKRFISIEKLYNWNVIPSSLKSEKKKYILGGQGNLWTEYINNESILEYQLFPRIAALCETLWTKPEYKNFYNFKKRLDSQLNRYTLWKTNYFGKIK